MNIGTIFKIVQCPKNALYPERFAQTDKKGIHIICDEGNNR